MTRSIILATVIGCGLPTSAMVTSHLQPQSQADADIARRVARRPLDATYIVPGNLAEIVSTAQAAVVASFHGRGDIT